MTISVVQHAAIDALNPGSGNFTLAFPSNNTTNNGLIYILEYSVAITSISDSNNTLTLIGSSADNTSASQGTIYVYFVPKCAAGANTISVTGTLAQPGSDGQKFYSLRIYEISDSAGNTNGFTNDLFAGTGAALTNASGGLSFSLGTNAQANEIIFMLTGIFGAGATWTAGAGFTAGTAGSHWDNWDQFKVVSASAAQTISYTSTAGNSQIALAAAASFFTAASSSSFHPAWATRSSLAIDGSPS